ncbi:MAG: hypothetical protein ABIH41_06455 [Nanoarchaeota archaeon]
MTWSVDCPEARGLTSFDDEWVKIGCKQLSDRLDLEREIKKTKKKYE